MIRRRLYAIVHDRVWLICLAVLFVLMLLQQDGYLDKQITTYNDHLRDLYEVEHTPRGSRKEESLLQSYQNRYGITVGSVQEFVDEHLSTVMQDMKVEVVELLSYPLFLLPLCVVPCCMSGRALSGQQALNPEQRRWRAVLLLLVETLLIILLLNAASKLLIVRKYMFHARVKTFNPVESFAWIRMLLVQPLAFFCILLLPISFLLCAFRNSTPAWIATVVLVVVMYLTWQADLLYLFLNVAADHLVFPLRDWLWPNAEQIPKVLLLCAILLALWTPASCLAYERRNVQAAV